MRNVNNGIKTKGKFLDKSKYRAKYNNINGVAIPARIH